MPFMKRPPVSTASFVRAPSFCLLNPSTEVVPSGAREVRHPFIRALEVARLSSPAHEWSRGVWAPSTRRLCDSSQATFRAHPPIEPARDRRGCHEPQRPPCSSVPLAQTGTADWWPQDCPTRGSYTVPSRSSAKRIPASRRASATTAIFFPRRAAIRQAHSRSSAVRGSRSRRIDTAAWISSDRTRPDRPW